MTARDRDKRYNASPKGKARNRRREQSPARKAYKAEKAREYRARAKRRAKKKA